MAAKLKPTKLAIDARMVTHNNPHGIARYTLEWLKYLADHPTGNIEACAITCQKSPLLEKPWAKSLTILTTPIPWLSISEQFLLPQFLKKHRIDLLHATSFAAPIFTSCPLTITIHDLNHVRLAKNYGTSQHLYYKYVVANALQKAKLIFTVSHFSKSEIESIYPQCKGKVIATLNGIDDHFELSSKQSSELQNYCIRQKPYFVAITSPKAHKKLEWIIQATKILKSADLQAKVIFVGKPEPHLTQLVEEQQLQKHILFAGTLSDEDLAHTYRESKGLLFPSEYEGFGLPVLEALSCGTSAICARSTSLPEIGGEFATYFESQKFESFYSCVRDLWNSTPTTKQLKIDRHNHANQFSWNSLGEKTLSEIKKILSAQKNQAT